jgi:molybdate transport system substrate-binding protein
MEMSLPVEVKVLSSIATREAYLELAPQFEHASGHKVTTTWAGTVDIMKRMAAGERHDVVMISSTEMDELIRQGKINPDSRVDMAGCGIGVAVRAGTPRPDISSGEALKRTLLAAKTVGYTSGPSGVYMADLIERMGIAADVKPKHRGVPSGGTIGTIVATGDAEIGFQQVSELVHIQGIDYVGPLPADVQKITVFSAGIQVGARQVHAAKALLAFLTSSAAAPIYKKHGLEPRSSDQRFGANAVDAGENTPGNEAGNSATGVDSDDG